MNDPAPHRPPRLTLASVIDLEHQIQADRARPRALLNERDGAIGRQISADQLDDRTALVRWLQAVQPADAPGPGDTIERILHAASSLAAVLGLLIGTATVATWLSVQGGRPINAIHFWSVLVGLQLLFLLAMLLAVACPGVLRRTLLAPARTLAAALTWLAGRFLPGRREAIQFALGLARQYDRLYGRIRLWLLLQLTQTFAIALNVGFIAMFVFLALVSDPSFGWRSTLLDTATVHRFTQAVSLPWSWASSWGVLALEQIEATRYTSLDPRFLGRWDPGEPGMEVWTAWWPFLFMSLLVYGLVPRMVIALLCRRQLSRTLRSIPLTHAAVVEVCDRLRRPRIDTRATADESAAPPAPSHAAPSRYQPENGRDIHLLSWAGIGADDETLSRLVGDALHGTVRTMHRVGAVDRADDRTAIEAVRRQDRHGSSAGTPDAIALVVQAWEPPVGDYLDLIRDLRREAGASRLIAVLLYHQAADGDPVSPREEHVRQWRDHLGALADPYLLVQPLIVGDHA